MRATPDNPKVVETPLIRCPECGHVFKGEITDEGFIWYDYTNECPKCGYWILESEFERVDDDETMRP